MFGEALLGICEGRSVGRLAVRLVVSQTSFPWP